MVPLNDLPDFGASATRSHAVLLRGRLIAEERTAEELTALRAKTRELAEAHGLPLALVTTMAWEGTEGRIFAPAFVGVVLAMARDGDAPRRVSAADLEAPPIPESVWDALAAHRTDVDDASLGVWLLPTGWSSASLVAGEVVNEDESWEPGYGPWEGDVEGDALGEAISEDMSAPYARVDDDGLAVIAAADPPAYLVCRYI